MSACKSDPHGMFGIPPPPPPPPPPSPPLPASPPDPEVPGPGPDGPGGGVPGPGSGVPGGGLPGGFVPGAVSPGGVAVVGVGARLLQSCGNKRYTTPTHRPRRAQAPSDVKDVPPQRRPSFCSAAPAFAATCCGTDLFVGVRTIGPTGFGGAAPLPTLTIILVSVVGPDLIEFAARFSALRIGFRVGAGAGAGAGAAGLGAVVPDAGAGEVGLVGDVATFAGAAGVDATGAGVATRPTNGAFARFHAC